MMCYDIFLDVLQDKISVMKYFKKKNREIQK